METRSAKILCLALIALVTASTVMAQKWETDFEKAKEAAEASNRYLLLNFSGSDWCGWCVKLDEEVFSKRAFKKYADENLVIVELDFPRKTTLKKSLREQNEGLSRQYGIRGFPTILILSPTGEQVAKTGYQRGGPDKYVEHLQGYIDAHRRQHNIPEPSAITRRQTSRAARAAAAGAPTE